MVATAEQVADFVIFDKAAAGDNRWPDRAAVLEALKETGAVIVRGHLGRMEDFIAFSDLFTKAVPYVGGANAGRAAVEEAEAVYTVTEPSLKKGMPLHGEMHHTHLVPELLWFYCVTPAVSEGETTFGDGRKVLAALSPATRRAFEERDVLYRRNYAPAVWQYVYHTDNIADIEGYCRANHIDLAVHADGAISTTYRTSAIYRSPDGASFINNILTFAAMEYVRGSSESQVRWGDGEEIPRPMLLELNAAAERIATAHAWRPGDAMLLDNTRVMHGRRAFNDDQRNIVIRLGMCRERVPGVGHHDLQLGRNGQPAEALAQL